MSEIRFRAWHTKENKMYFRAYQKLSHVLLCENDHGKNDGKGIPAARASYEDCILLQSTTLEDKNGQEIFEGDIVRAATQNGTFCDVVRFIPDMFKSRKLSPLHSLLERNHITNSEEIREIEIAGNRFETPDLLKRCGTLVNF